jgi:3-hydroxyisobutyrate dehydrogenase-like beta-hydroxyacid dehydrogenase
MSKRGAGVVSRHVGFIGLGRIGLANARRLVDDGHSVARAEADNLIASTESG